MAGASHERKPGPDQRDAGSQVRREKGTLIERSVWMAPERINTDVYALNPW
jgi:hypothetical protein